MQRHGHAALLISGDLPKALERRKAISGRDTLGNVAVPMATKAKRLHIRKDKFRMGGVE